MESLLKSIIKTSFENKSFSIALFHNVSDIKPKDLFLFVHGFPDSHETWSHQVEYFKSKAYVAAFDLRGTSDSHGPRSQKGYSIEEVLKDFDLVINYLKKQNPKIKKIHLVGHDWGAILGWAYISDKTRVGKIGSYTAMGGIHSGHIIKENLLKLISFNPSKLFQALDQFSHSWYVYFFQLPFFPEASLTVFNNYIFKKALAMAQLPKSDPMWRWRSAKIDKAGSNAIKLYRQLVRNPPQLPDQLIEVPVCQYIFKQDAFVRPASFENQQDLCKNYQVAYFDCNHWGHRSHFGLINEQLEKLL